MTSRERCLRDLESFWHDFEEGVVPIRDLAARRHSGGPSRTHAPGWFARGLSKNWRPGEILELANIAWATSRGHVDSFRLLLREMLEEATRQGHALRLQDLKRLCWRNQKRRQRARRGTVYMREGARI